MEKGRKRVRFCVLFVVLAAAVIGILYYYGQQSEQSGTNEGTLISNLETGIKRLCR